MSLNHAVSFPLSKVSLATDPENTTKFSWTHAYQEVSILFDNYGSSFCDTHPHSVFKIMQGAKTLDRVNLAEKIREADHVIDHARKMNLQLKADQIPTTLIYRRTESNSIIALRYPLPDKMTRRVQLRFSFPQDFETALSIFQSLGCYLQNFDSKSEAVPSSAAGGSTSFRPPIQDAVVRPMSSDSHHFANPQHARHTFTFSSPRPNTPLYPIQEHEPAMHSDTVRQNIGGFDGRSQHIDPLRRIPVTTSRIYHLDKSLSNPTISTSAMDTNSVSKAHSRFFPHTSNSNTRPSTAPMKTLTELDDELSALIPPRRDLPFERPGSKQSNVSRGNSASRPTSSADLPPLPRPSFIRPVSVDSSKKTTIVTQNSVSSLNGATSATIKTTTKRPQSTAVSSAPNKRPKSDNTPTFIVATRPSTALPSGSPKKIKNNSSSTPITSNSILDTNPSSDDSALVTALSRITPVMSMSTLAVPAIGKEDLKEYTALPYEQRMSKIEGIIINAVEDEAFITLCEDVYGCWQRIGFGL